jgi:hypothetical protein
MDRMLAFCIPAVQSQRIERMFCLCPTDRLNADTKGGPAASRGARIAAPAPLLHGSSRRASQTPKMELFMEKFSP